MKLVCTMFGLSIPYVNVVTSQYTLFFSWRGKNVSMSGLEFENTETQQEIRLFMGTATSVKGV